MQILCIYRYKNIDIGIFLFMTMYIYDSLEVGGFQERLKFRQKEPSQMGRPLEQMNTLKEHLTDFRKQRKTKNQSF